MDETISNPTSDNGQTMKLFTELKNDLRKILWSLTIFTVLFLFMIIYWGMTLQRGQVDHSSKISDIERGLLDNIQSIMALESRLPARQINLSGYRARFGNNQLHTNRGQTANGTATPFAKEQKNKASAKAIDGNETTAKPDEDDGSKKPTKKPLPN